MYFFVEKILARILACGENMTNRTTRIPNSSSSSAACDFWLEMVIPRWCLWWCARHLSTVLCLGHTTWPAEGPSTRSRGPDFWSQRRRRNCLFYAVGWWNRTFPLWVWKLWEEARREDEEEEGVHLSQQAVASHLGCVTGDWWEPWRCDHQRPATGPLQ